MINSSWLSQNDPRKRRPTLKSIGRFSQIGHTLHYVMSFSILFHDDSNVSSYECSQTYVIFLYNEDRTVKAAHYFRDGQEEKKNEIYTHGFVCPNP